MMRYLCLLLCVSASIVGAQVPPGAQLEKILSGFQFVEGPVWKEGVGLLFSDITTSTIYCWTQADSSVSIYLKPSDSSNGLTFDRNGNLLLTQMRTRRVSRREASGTITPLVTLYNGKRFNSPNDIVVSPGGSIFFTDPDFNTPVGEPKELAFKGIFRLSAAGQLKVMDSTFDKPNGICFSPAGDRLYVNESAQHTVYVWDVVDDSTISNKRVFYVIPQTGYADGMKVDRQGNVYCAGPGGIWIISPAGSFLAKISVPESPTNCAWGDPDRGTLYITAGKSIYRIRLVSPSGVGREEPGQRYELGESYPNPFNGSTQIEFRIAGSERVGIRIFDALGREVSMLLDETKPPGQYTARWEAGGMPSGVYFCRMTVGGNSAVRRMILAR